MYRPVAGDSIQAEEGGVQLAAEQEAAIFVPPERLARVAAVFGEASQVVGGVGQFQHARHNEVEFDGLIRFRKENRELIKNKIA